MTNEEIEKRVYALVQTLSVDSYTAGGHTVAGIRGQATQSIAALACELVALAYEEAAQVTLALEQEESGDYDEGYSDRLHEAARDVRALRDLLVPIEEKV